MRVSLTVLCLVAAASLAAAGSETEDVFQRARTRLKQAGTPGEAENALSLMKQAAAMGHAEATGAVGFFYATGKGVEKDEATAAEWFRKGAELGGPKAMLNFGKALVEGRGIAENATAGREWIDKAAATGLAEAELEVGQAYFFGRSGRAVNYPYAVRYLERAAERNNAAAQSTLGVMVRDGIGTAQDLVRAENWLRKAAAQCDAKAQAALAHLLGPTNKDPARRLEALTFLVMAVEQGEITATKILADLGESVKSEELAEARKQAAKAAGGHPAR